MGKLEAAQWLLSRAKHLLDLADAEGLTPLHHASSQGHLDVVEWLVEQGAQPTAAMRSAAQEEGHSKVAKFLGKILKGTPRASSSSAQ